MSLVYACSPAAQTEPAVMPGLAATAPVDPTVNQVMVQGPTEPKLVDLAKITGSAYAEPREPAVTAAKGPITALTADPPDDDQTKWTLVVEERGKGHPFVFGLPNELALPVAVGAIVAVDLKVTGGGPNAMGTLVITDEHGGLVLAIHRLPTGWKAGYGRRLKIDKGTSYDEHTYSVAVRPPAGPVIELVASPWRAFEIAGVRYFGKGNAAKRHPHGSVVPPDYVGQWIDFTLLRVRS